MLTTAGPWVSVEKGLRPRPPARTSNRQRLVEPRTPGSARDWTPGTPRQGLRCQSGQNPHLGPDTASPQHWAGRLGTPGNGPAARPRPGATVAPPTRDSRKPGRPHTCLRNDARIRVCLWNGAEQSTSTPAHSCGDSAPPWAKVGLPAPHFHAAKRQKEPKVKTSLALRTAMDPEHPVASGTAPTRTGLPFGPCQVPSDPQH